MPYVELSVPRRRWIADLAEAAFAEAGGVIPVQPAPLIDEHGKRAYEAQATTGLSEIFEAPSTATFWFDRVSPSSPRNCVIVEQAVRLSQFGVLALLLFPKLP